MTARRGGPCLGELFCDIHCASTERSALLADVDVAACHLRACSGRAGKTRLVQHPLQKQCACMHVWHVCATGVLCLQEVPAIPLQRAH